MPGQDGSAFSDLQQDLGAILLGLMVVLFVLVLGTQYTPTVPTPGYARLTVLLHENAVPESMLTKKQNLINCHVVQETAAVGTLRVGKEDGETNLADPLTKVLTGQKRWDLCWHFMW